MLELIFRHLLVDFPFVCYFANSAFSLFVRLPFRLAVSIGTPSLARASTSAYLTRHCMFHVILFDL
jgi:hypothetical protein